jgi:hypothetical protein
MPVLIVARKILYSYGFPNICRLTMIPAFLLPAPSRLRAFLWHLLVSGVLGLSALALVFLIWYPAPLHEAVGVTDIFLLLLCVDVILGPCLTFAVAKPGKKKKLLLLDLGIIITVQLAAFSYGIYTVFEGRPVWVVLNKDRFDVVCNVDIDPKHAAQALPEYQRPSWGRPQWVFTPLPEDAETRSALLFSFLEEGQDIYQQPRFYRPLAEARAQIQKNAQSLEALEAFNTVEEIQEKLAPYPDANAWMPLKSKTQDMVVLVRKEEGHIIAPVNLRPWTSSPG